MPREAPPRPRRRGRAATAGALAPAASVGAFVLGALLVGQALAEPVADAWRQHRLRQAVAGGGVVGVGDRALVPALRVRVVARAIDCVAVATRSADVASLDESLGDAPVAWRPRASGPTCVAAHRDAHFRRLADVELGDRVEIVRAGGRAESLRVARVEVVEPHDLTSLAGLGARDVVLVTCWPADAVGPAPHRLVVVASPSPSGEWGQDPAPPFNPKSMQGTDIGGFVASDGGSFHPFARHLTEVATGHGNGGSSRS